jgi:hypothetical protein
MQQIYTRADRVFLSMIGAQNVRPTFDWLRGIIETSSAASDTTTINQYQKSQNDRMVCARSAELDTEDRQPLDRRYPTNTWDVMYDILEHPWWSRAWVYQEFITASRTIVLFSNNNWIDWNDLHPLLMQSLSLSVDQHLAACNSYCKHSQKQAGRKYRCGSFLQPCSEVDDEVSKPVKRLYKCICGDEPERGTSDSE